MTKTYIFTMIDILDGSHVMTFTSELDSDAEADRMCAVEEELGFPMSWTRAPDRPSTASDDPQMATISDRVDFERWAVSKYPAWATNGSLTWIPEDETYAGGQASAAWAAWRAGRKGKN